MNEGSDNMVSSTGNDPLVSAEYRAAATERTPPELDGVVLEKARATAGSVGLRRFTAYWFRPVAFVATLALSLALILELTRTADQQGVDSPEPGAGRRQSEKFEVDPNAGTDRPAGRFGEDDDSPGGKDQAAKPEKSSEALGTGLTEEGAHREGGIIQGNRNRRRCRTETVHG
jgi:hypothetical protein